MSLGLPVSRLINVTITLEPLAAAFLNLQTLLILGDSDVIDTGERMRAYSSLTEVATDFSSDKPEYAAAALYFEQAPKPNQLFVGRWAQAATKGKLDCGILTSAQQALAVWQAFTAGKFKIQVDSAPSPVEVTCATMAGVGNLNAVATIINSGLTGASVAATCAWVANMDRFEFKSNSTGANSKVLPLTAGTSQDMSGALRGTTALGAVEVDGIVAETALAAVMVMDQQNQPWYGLTVASANVDDDDHVAIAEYIEGSGNLHMYGVSTMDTDVIDPMQSSDIASVLSLAGYRRTFVHYSSYNNYSAASLFGRILTTNFNMNNSMITLMWKQMPGITPETLTTTAANTLENKRANYFARFNNNTAIVVGGVVSGPAYIDEIYGCDWLANRVQTDVFNLFYTTPTKIPQTDAGDHLIAVTIEASCAAGVNNGLLAEGVWNSAGFGQLKQGDIVKGGYYVYCPPIATQAAADRAQRKSVPFQVAAKLAGAIHTADISILVNR